MVYVVFSMLAVSCLAVQAKENVRFGSQSSAIRVTDDSYMNIKKASMNVNQGKISRTATGSIVGKTIDFSQGTFASFNSESRLTGQFKPSGTASDIGEIPPSDLIGSIEIGQNPNPDLSDVLVANPGGLNHTFFVKAGVGFLRGQPLFFGVNDIALENFNTVLAIAIQNTLNTNITLNNGVIFLQDDLRLGDNAVIQDDGVVILNNRRLSLGSAQADWTGSILWDQALDIQLNSRVNLFGNWFFAGDSQINGNGNVLDITGGGALIVLPGTTLRISGVQLKGLGSGSIFIFPGGQVTVSDVQIEMNDSYNLDSGTLYIDGNTTIITRDNFFTVMPGGKLIVDSVALTYDPLDFIDQFNIRPLRIQDPAHEFIEILNGGSIRKVRSESISFLDYSSDTVLERYGVATPNKKIRIFPEVINDQLNFEVTVNGNTNFLLFTRADEPLLEISDNVHMTYKNIVLREFSPKHLTLGSGATLVFGDKTTIEFARDEELNTTWYFSGDTILNGRGSTLTLGQNGNIVITGDQSSLTLKNIVIKGATASNIRCEQNSSTLIFDTVRWIQSGDFTFDTGGIWLVGDWTLYPPVKSNDNQSAQHKFFFTTSKPLRILSDSTMFMTPGAYFAYNPVDSSQPLFLFSDASATLDLSSATLALGAPLLLDTGRVVLRGRNLVLNQALTDVSDDQILTFGENLLLDQSAGGVFEITGL